MTEREPLQKWQYRIEDSGIASMVDAAIDELDELTIVEDTERADVERIRAVLGHVHSRLDLADPVLASEAGLTEIAGALAALRASIDQVRTSGNSAYLGNAMSAIDPLLSAIGRLPAIETADDAAAALKAFKGSVAGTKAQTTKSLDELRNTISARLAELEQRSDTVATELGRLEQILSNTLATTQAAQESQRVSFDESQASRSTMWERQVTEWRTNFERLFVETRDELHAQQDAYQERFEAAITAAEQSNQRINTILGIVADKGLVGQYSLTAQRERRSVLIWRILAGVVAIGAIGIAFEAARHASSVDDNSWRPLVAKLAVTIVVAGLAAYCGNTANDHRRAEHAAEQTALQLAAIKPFLQDISNDQLRDDVLVSTAARIFARPTAEHVGDVPTPTLAAHAADRLGDDIARAIQNLITAQLGPKP